jgi:lipoprotein NlpI
MRAMRTLWSRSICGREEKKGRTVRGCEGSRAGVLVRTLIVSAVAFSVPLVVAAQGVSVQTRAMLENGIEAFLAGRVEESVTLFDRVAKEAPAVAPELWQRGIALYYVGRYADCRRQFESHRTVNPNDVENPAWHFLCVAKLESPARAKAALLPVGPDQRSPMREVYQMFQGTLPPQKVLDAATQGGSARFYAELYVGLYYEALGDDKAALTHLKAAASDQHARAGGYMHRVAQLHPRVRAR